jgi:hypothetical protein
VALAFTLLPLTAFAGVRDSAEDVIVYIMSAASLHRMQCRTSQTRIVKERGWTKVSEG